MKTLRGKKVLLTGAASGIGRALALALAREGADLYLVDVDDAKLAGVVAEVGRFGTCIVARHCDVSCPDEISATVDSLLARWGHVDILVNNAGVAYYGRTDRMTADRWDWLLGINLLAPVQFTRELLPTLLSRPEAHILNVCSILGLVAIGRATAYQVSKFGLVGLSESLRTEYGRFGLGVTALCPGFVRTSIFQAAKADRDNKTVPTPPPWLCTTPEKIAARAVRAIYKNQGVVLVTPLARVLWLVKRLAPGLWDLISRAGRRKTLAAPGPEQAVILPGPQTNTRRSRAA